MTSNSLIHLSLITSAGGHGLALGGWGWGMEKIFFRTGAISRLEEQRDLVLSDVIIHFQAHCRGYLARKRLEKRKVQETAIRCIQKNVRKFIGVRDWPWWRLLVRVTPLLNVHRTEEELRTTKDELETLRARLDKAEKERTTLKHDNEKLEARHIPLCLSVCVSSGSLLCHKLATASPESTQLQLRTDRVVSVAMLFLSCYWFGYCFYLLMSLPVLPSLTSLPPSFPLLPSLTSLPPSLSSLLSSPPFFPLLPPSFPLLPSLTSLPPSPPSPTLDTTSSFPNRSPQSLHALSRIPSLPPVPSRTHPCTANSSPFHPRVLNPLHYLPPAYS
ncbi:hypothetical protein Pmani_002864 [Petrolisthes manimaculis]|uniref:Myosin heavy chain n=1 Tax=Petrolisthes manimaculis TaxID=1843537 RepID=A0AAE1UJZ3_9EUCA|nr:hypothetical protein Pmani_002864 [Petrolisthes manimaculis]